MNFRKRLLAIVFAPVVVCAAGSMLVHAAPPDVDMLKAILVELRNLNTTVAGQKACCPIVENARLSESLVVDPLVGSSHTLVSIAGPGKFVSARLTKQGGASGLTFVTLRLDGQIIESRSVIALKNFGMTEQNPFGVKVGTSAAGIDVVTLGFPQTLSFKNQLELEVTVNEPGVVQMIGSVIAGN